MTTSCVFCRLLSGDGEADWIWRGDAASALVPLNSAWPGHTLVISNEHAVGVQDVSLDALQATTALLQRVAQQMAITFGAEGVNILNASGPGSGQSVDHLHFHLVPKWPDDGMDLWPHGQQSMHTIATDWAAQLNAQLQVDPTGYRFCQVVGAAACQM